MIYNIKYNIWVFFARICTKRDIKKLKRELGILSQYIVVTKDKNPKFYERFKKVKTALFIAETTLKGLQYNPLYSK